MYMLCLSGRVFQLLFFIISDCGGGCSGQFFISAALKSVAVQTSISSLEMRREGYNQLGRLSFDMKALFS